MSRITLVKVHLILSALFLPLLFVIPLSGGLYLVGIKGEQTKTEAFRMSGPVPEEKTAQEAFFRDEFARRDLDFDFEYIRSSGNDLIFRPSSRVHYAATKGESEVTVFKVEPDFVKRMIEVHKGHGPTWTKWIQTVFAGALLLVTLSGIYLAMTIASYRKLMLVGAGVGSLLILASLF